MRKQLMHFAVIFLLLISQNTNAQMGDWKILGPKKFPINDVFQINGQGRVCQIKFHPVNPLKMYAVSGTGGLFISNDQGENWTSTGTDNLPGTEFASICIDHTNDQVLYLGTGDPNYYSTYYGYGIWKSTDGGATWVRSSNGVGNRMAVEILMSPTNRNVLVAATNDGIWKSTDAGASWTVKKTGGDFTDMQFQPGSSSVMYATTHSEYFRSTNGGDSWTKISLPGSGFERGGRIGVTKADPQVVYLTFVGNFDAGTSTPVLKSTNAGQSFSIVKSAGQPNLNGYNGQEGGQGNYNYCLIVDPTNSNTLYISGHLVWKSTNGGVSWNYKYNWWEGIHTDMHYFAFAPNNSSKLFNANDGGVWVTTDGGNIWTPKSDGLSCTECYSGVCSPIRKGVAYIGTQDNGAIYYNGSDPWHTYAGGDVDAKMFASYAEPTTAYYVNDGRRRIFAGNSTSWNQPYGSSNSALMIFSPSQTNICFSGLTDVYRSTNITAGSPSWTKITNINSTLKAIAVSPTDANELYVVNYSGTLYRCTNALSSSPSFVSSAAPGTTINTSSIAVVKSNTNVVYMSCGGKVYRSGNKGANWTEVTANLPSTINAIKIANDVYSTNEAIYVVYPTAIYYKDNSMTNWINYSKGLPTAPKIRDFAVYNDGTANSALRIFTYGRGVWESPLYGGSSNLRDPENPTTTVNGLDYKYYTGSWSNLPNFGTLAPVKTGTVANVDLTPRTVDDEFGFSYTGYVNVPTDGVYSFSTSSDDGSRLYIGSQLVVDNDGLHGNQEVTGAIGLKAGKHAIRIEFFEAGGAEILTTSYEGPGITKQAIPNTAFFRVPPVILRDPENPANTVNGLDYKYYHGTWDVLPDFNALAPVKTGTVTNFDLTPRTQDDDFGFSYTGYVNVPADGSYTFYTSSDDGSRLYIGTQLVVDNDGLHGSIEESGVIGLKAGKHALRVTFFENGGAQLLDVRYSGPSISKQLIPNTALYRIASSNIPVTGVTLVPTTVSITAGTSQQLTATVLPSDATNKNVLWTTSNGTIATVNATGLVSALAIGNATITVTTQDGSKTATCAVTVATSNIPVTGVTVTPTTASLVAGNTQQLTATVLPANATNKNVAWSTSNATVATVNSSGLISALTAGTAIITVTTLDGSKTATCTVTVTSGGSSCSFGAPLASALPTINNKSYNNVHVLGTGGPNLSNVSNFTINWDLPNNGLWQFSMNTNNGVPNWWNDFLPKVTQNFNSAQPAIKITNSGFTGLDGDYWAAIDGANFVLVSKTGGFTIYFSNSSTPPSCTKGAIIDENDIARQEGILLFPNPIDLGSNLIVQLRSIDGNGATLTITDVSGKTVYTEVLKNTTNAVAIGKIMSAGIYNVNIINGSTQINQKLIIK